MTCPICRERRARREADKDVKEGVSSTRTDSYINCYVISNPADRTSEGKVKILKMPSKILHLFEQATSGDRKDEYGSARVMSLERGSVTLAIVVGHAKSGYVSYDESYFISPEASYKDIESMTVEEKDRIWGECFNIKEELGDTIKPESEESIIKRYINDYLIPRGMTPSTEEVMKHFPKNAMPVDVENVVKPPQETVEAKTENEVAEIASNIEEATTSELESILK